MRLIKIALVFVLTVAVGLTAIPSLYADETSEIILKLLIKKGIVSEEEIEEMKAEVAREKAEAEVKVPEDLEERVTALEEKVEERGFLSAKGADFQLVGELELEFVKTDGDGAEDKPRFQLDKFVLQPKLKVSDQLSLDALIYVLESGNNTYLNEIHAKFSDFPFLNSWLDVGLYERWIKDHHGRKTEGYPLIGTAFYRDDALTLTWGAKYEPFYWMLSLGNGYEIDQKQVSEDSASKSKIIHDDHATSGLSESLEYGINLGFRKDLASMGKVDILGFFYTDELASADITNLQSNLPSYTSDEDDKRRYGLGTKYLLNDWRFYGAYIQAEDGALDRDGFFVEGSYHFKFKDRKWLSGVMPLVSYGQLNVDNTKSFANPWSWDRENWILALLFDLYQNTKLKAEYYINDEDTGGGGFDNDEFLMQLEVKF